MLRSKTVASIFLKNVVLALLKVVYVVVTKFHSSQNRFQRARQTSQPLLQWPQWPLNQPHPLQSPVWRLGTPTGASRRESFPSRKETSWILSVQPTRTGGKWSWTGNKDLFQLRTYAGLKLRPHPVRPHPLPFFPHPPPLPPLLLSPWQPTTRWHHVRQSCRESEFTAGNVHVCIICSLVGLFVWGRIEIKISPLKLHTINTQHIHV